MTDLRLSVPVEPTPGLLRPAIEAALAGRPWPPGPEATIAAAVVAAVRAPDAGRPAPAGPVPPGTAGTRTTGAPGIRTAGPTEPGGGSR